MFDTLAARFRDAVTPNDEAMATTFNTYVGNFVKTGDPNGEALPDLASRWSPISTTC